MKPYLKIIFSCFVIIPLFIYPAHAAQFGGAFGNIGEVAAGGVGTGAPPRNLLYFTIVGSVSIADCASSTSPHFVINLDEGGNTMASLLLSSKIAEKKIHVVGRGTCTYISGHEDVSLIYMD